MFWCSLAAGMSLSAADGDQMLSVVAQAIILSAKGASGDLTTCIGVGVG